MTDKTRAQPAVRLTLVENPVNGGMHIRLWENLSGLGAGEHLLYAGRGDQDTADAIRYRKLLHLGLRFMAGGVLHKTKAETDAAIDALPDPLAIGGIKVVIDETLPPGSWRVSGHKRADQE